MDKTIVAIHECSDYEIENVSAAVRQCIVDLGGIDVFALRGKQVFLKLNLLIPKEPEGAVTTHPSLVRAMVQELEDAGASVVVGDSPSGPFTKGRLEKAYKRSGVFDAIDGTQAKLNWDLGSVRVDHPDGRLVRNLEVLKAVTEVDAIVSLPKLKTHSFTTFTGGVKVMYGVVPGLGKAAYHAKLPKVRDFSDMLLDVYTYSKPVLTVMDGVVGMEGDGPSAGKPKRVGAILASSDAIALDVIACELVGLDPWSVPTNRNAIRRGLSSGRIEDIELVGTPLSSFSGVRFEPPSGSSGLNRFHRLVHRIAGKRYTRPVPDPTRCNGCGECEKSCPKHCITIEDGLARMDYEKCIRCFCCHEVCPERAIDLRKGLFSG